MPKHVVAVALAVVLMTASAPGWADCAYDISQLQAKVAHEPDKAKAAAVRQQLDKAQAQRRTSETECLNAVTRGWRALHAPPEATKARAPNTTTLPNYAPQ